MALSTTERVVKESTTAVYGATLQDNDGNAVSAADLDSLTLTLWDKVSETIINSRNAQNVLNTNNVTVSDDGVLAWTMQPDDNVIVDTNHLDGQKEEHRALFQWTWDTNKYGKYEVVIDVQQLTKVT